MFTKTQNISFSTSHDSRKFFSVLYCAFLLCFTLFSSKISLAQAEKDALIKNISKAVSDSERIVSLGKLANFYFKQKEEAKADSLINKQLMIAEETGNPTLITLVLFDNPRYNFPASASKNISDKSYDYIIKALEFAKREGLNIRTALAYSNLAALYQAEGKMDEALKNANLGYATAQTTGNDSVKVLCALQLGHVYENKSEAVMAFKTYTNAFDIANHSQNSTLLSLVYHSISNLYKNLDQAEIARSYIFKSLAVNKQNNSVEGQLKDYIALGKLSDYDMAISYAERAEQLADSLKNEDYIIQAQKIIFNQKLVVKDPATALNYLNKHNDLVAYYKNTGSEYFNWVIGEVYLYGKKPDTALAYFNNAEAAFAGGYDINSKKSFYEEFGLCYKQINNVPFALKYYQQSLDISKATGDLKGIVRISKEMKNLYQQQNNFKQALYFSNQYELYQDSVAKFAKDRDLALLEIENENKRRAREEELAQIKEDRRHNLQYMGITMAIASIFILLITIGMFRVHKFTIKILGFLSFIFLFEFLLMLLEKVIHHITDGEPWKVWLIKITLVSFIFPIHHYLEENLIHYLMSRKLIEIRHKYSLSKYLLKLTRKPKVEKIEDDELSAAPSPFR